MSINELLKSYSKNDLDKTKLEELENILRKEIRNIEAKIDEAIDFKFNTPIINELKSLFRPTNKLESDKKYVITMDKSYSISDDFPEDSILTKHSLYGKMHIFGTHFLYRYKNSSTLLIKPTIAGLGNIRLEIHQYKVNKKYRYLITVSMYTLKSNDIKEGQPDTDIPQAMKLYGTEIKTTDETELDKITGNRITDMVAILVRWLNMEEHKLTKMELQGFPIDRNIPIETIF